MSSWRSERPVLVTDAHAMGSIGVIRSLGRGGYPVHACSTREDALGLFSHYCHARAVCPGYDAPSYISWLRQYARAHQIRTIIPSEGFLLAIRPVFSEFAPLLPYTQPEEVVYAGMSKADQFQLLSSSQAEGRAAEHLPRSVLVEESRRLPELAQLKQLDPPLFLKVDGSYGIGWENSAVYRAVSAESALEMLPSLRGRFRKILIQGAVPGRGVAAFFLLWKGQLLADFMHMRLHEVPHTGGVSSYRKSWWHPAIREDALAKQKRLRWEGVAMMEYRWDATTDEFCFLEMNGRFWGSLHLALYAGMDFPLLLLDAFGGHLPDPVCGSSARVRCRYTFPREVEYVWSRLKDRRLPLLSKLWSVLEFFLLALDPRLYSDLLFPGDRKIYWMEFRRFWKEYVFGNFRSRVKKTD